MTAAPSLFDDTPLQVPPLAMQLRPYQQEAVDSIFAWFERETGNPLVVLPTGAGKSLVLAAFIHAVLSAYPRERILVLTHVKELIAQNHAQLLRCWPGAPAGICSAGLRRREHDAPILFAGIQSTYRHAAKIGWVDLVLVDECFVRGTLIETPTGPRPIEEIREGDLVLNATGIGRVEVRRERSSSDLFDVYLDDGTHLRCTGSHPFFTNRGWVNASQLDLGEVLVGAEALRSLWHSLSSLEEDAGRWGGPRDEGEALGPADMLLALLCEEASEPDERQPGAHADARVASQDQAQADPTRWEWAASVAASARSVARSRRGLGVGARDTHGGAGPWSPDQLQDRHREQSRDVGDRARRRLAQLPAEARTGSAEGRLLDSPRVARVSRSERGGAQAVFNLRVSGHPSYFAGGVLVHNCHLIPKDGVGMYRALLKDLLSMNSKLKVIGLTATPFRTSEGSLDAGADRMFHGIAYSASLVELIRDGYLSPVTTKATAAEVSTSGVHRQGGEFVAKELEDAALSGDLVERACREIIARGADRKAWLVFCCGVRHARAVAAQIEGAGIKVACIFGDTEQAERDEAIAAFKAGRLRCIVNVNVLTTGFDAPHVDLIALLRPTCSPGLYVQMVGRGLRKAPGKNDALILDFGSNAVRHGPIDAIAITQPKDRKDDPKDITERVLAKACPKCQSLVAVAVRQCPDCGHMWPEPTPDHAAKPDEQATLVQGTHPTGGIERWNVQRTFYRMHQKDKSKPPTLCVEYRCGFHQTAREWVCIEHTGYARHKAVAWWKNHGGQMPAPETVDSALLRIECRELLDVAVITVDVRGEYPEVKGARMAAREAGEQDFAAVPKPDTNHDDIPF